MTEHKTKTPFELRFDILALATQFIDSQNKLIASTLDASTDIGKKTLDSLAKSYDTENLMKLANQFNDFISKKN